MKKNRIKKSRDTVPLNITRRKRVCVSLMLAVYDLLMSFFIKLDLMRVEVCTRCSGEERES